MNADLLAMLGQVPGVGSSNRRENEPKTLLSFKAGKMLPTLQPNGKYLVTSDPRRGLLEVTWTANGGSSSGGRGSSSGGNGSGSGNSNGNGGVLKMEWRDRRTRAVVDTLTIFPEDDCSYSKVDTGREGDRVYLLQYGNASDRRFFFWMQEGLDVKPEGDEHDADADADKEMKEDGEGNEEEKEEEEDPHAGMNQDEINCVKINTFMAEPEQAARVANGGKFGESGKDDDSDDDGDANMGTTGDKKSKGSSSGSGTDANASGALDSNALMSIMQGLNATGAGAGAGAVSEGVQVDALSNILENLGMPQSQSQSTASASASASASATDTSSAADTNAASVSSTAAVAATPVPSSTPSVGLTLSDLQGAMAGLATTSPPSSTSASLLQQPPGPPLNEVVSPSNILDSGILENEALKEKLMELLPENQRSESQLMENIRSPQVQQCLKSLTAILCDDEDASGINSILANFQLRPEDGAIAMATGNPIQAFLDCVLKSAQRENDAEDAANAAAVKDEDGDGEDKDSDAEMKE